MLEKKFHRKKMKTVGVDRKTPENGYQKNSSLRFLVLIVRFSCQTNSGDVKCPKQYNFKIFLKNFDPSFIQILRFLPEITGN
jgi:hypothetical protein